ncbi:MAG: hypothetical protein KJZ80_07275 [Hyphomicrobiaceae bacterium]|nr:hypothetical protein [Hyphomicrobiaceae bacterium]
MRKYLAFAVAPGLLLIAGSGAPEHAAAQGSGIARSDVATVFGYYGVSDGNSDRRFATAWANVVLAAGLGAHAEVHAMDREEDAGYFAGGLSWNTRAVEVRGWLGTSTANAGILPELHARLEAAYRTRAELGLVLQPAVSFRSYRNGAEEAAIEAQVLKYTAVGSGSLVLSALARAMLADPGSRGSASFGAGLTYAECRRFSIGLSVEGGRAAYDGLLAPGTVDERYFSIRPAASLFLTDRIELIGLAEYSGRESYDVYGGHVGLKVHLD